jgi:hypothetical protein
MAAAETGADTFAASGTSQITGSMAAAETGADTFAASGTSQVTGSMAAAETGADTFAASSADLGEITGAMAATETGADTFFTEQKRKTGGLQFHKIQDGTAWCEGGRKRRRSAPCAATGRNTSPGSAHCAAGRRVKRAGNPAPTLFGVGGEAVATGGAKTLRASYADAHGGAQVAVLQASFLNKSGGFADAVGVHRALNKPKSLV